MSITLYEYITNRKKCQYMIHDSFQIFIDIRKSLYEEKPVPLHYNSLTFGTARPQQLIPLVLLPY